MAKDSEVYGGAVVHTPGRDVILVWDGETVKEVFSQLKDIGYNQKMKWSAIGGIPKKRSYIDIIYDARIMSQSKERTFKGSNYLWQFYDWAGKYLAHKN